MTASPLVKLQQHFTKYDVQMQMYLGHHVHKINDCIKVSKVLYFHSSRILASPHLFTVFSCSTLP